MFVFAILFLVLHVVGCIESARGYAKCKTNVVRPSGNYQFSCLGLTSLHSYMEKGPSNTTNVSIVNSKITAVPRYSFVRFGTTLESLELRNCRIERIEPEGFASLFRLQKLVLAENNLIAVSAEWFRDSSYLRELDVSFNKIMTVDYAVYQRLPNLEVFYFDYNQLVTIDYSMFPLLGYLRKVKLGHNPWNWGYRIRLTWQLDNQRVNYEDDWEEWGWMSSTVRECEEDGKGVVPNDTILDCVIGKLLSMEVGNKRNISSVGTQKIELEGRCFNEATTLVHCSMRSVPPRESVVATGDDTTSVDTIRFACFSIAQIFHLFCNTLPGHWVIESSSLVSDAAYSCKWHMMSLRSRKLILFLIRASINPCKITAGKMYFVSMENFSAVLRTSVSYLAVLNSMQ